MEGSKSTIARFFGAVFSMSDKIAESPFEEPITTDVSARRQESWILTVFPNGSCCHARFGGLIR